MKTIISLVASSLLVLCSLSLHAQDVKTDKKEEERRNQSAPQRSAGTGCQMDVQGLSTSTSTVLNSESTFLGSNDVIAVNGRSVTNTTGYGIGGRFEGGYRGVLGVIANLVEDNANFGTVGVYGQNFSIGSGDKYGVRGLVNTTSTSGNNYAVYGQASGGAGSTNWAGYFQGNVNVTGDIAATKFIGDGSQLTNLPSSGGGGCNDYGDGSAGDLTISGSVDWSMNPPTNGNYMFQNLTISSGATLTVASGTIIKVSQIFTNQGTITVDEGIPGERWAGNTDGGFPRIKGNTLSFNDAYNSEQLRFLSSSSLIVAGSPGSDGGFTGVDAEGGFGAGALSIKAIDIINNGTIRSNGGNGATLPSSTGIAGCGGGGGGFIVLQGNNISNTGTIEAKGGDGGSPGLAGDDLAGGGGGGGLIHLISPNATSVSGTLTVDGGAAGTTPSGNTDANGGTGGAGAGNGGYGGFSDFASPPNITPAEAGGIGIVLRTQVTDPCSFSN